jgi:hypothetical protein
MGTLSYMAPEQGLEGKCDIRSDIYSLGIVFYELLTGRVPFDADTPLAILMKHVNDPLPLPRTIDPTIPEPFERVVLKALAKNPKDRFQTTAEMTSALDEAARQSGIEPSDRIILPEPVKIVRSPRDSVAVFSGREKEKITDKGFAANDTDITFSPPKEKKSQGERKRTRAALTAITLIIFANMFILWASGVFGWTVIGRVWPLELVVVGVLFFALMIEQSNPWFLIPGGLVLGNGLLLAYFSLTGRWEDWAYLWPIEPLIVAASIIAPFWLTKRTDSGRSFIRWFAVIMLALAGITFVITMAVAILQP